MKLTILITAGIAATGSAVPFANQSSSTYTIARLGSNTASGRRGSTNNSISFIFVDNASLRSGSCSQSWDWHEKTPKAAGACSNKFFTFKIDNYVNIKNFRLTLFDTISDPVAEEFAASRTCWRQGAANFTTDSPKWSYQCGGSGACHAFAQTNVTVPVTDVSATGSGPEDLRDPRCEQNEWTNM